MSNARHTLTYSFMAAANSAQTNDNDGFQAMNARTQQAVRDALAYVAQVADITFVEDNSGSGNLQFGNQRPAWREWRLRESRRVLQDRVELEHEFQN